MYNFGEYSGKLGMLKFNLDRESGLILSDVKKLVGTSSQTIKFKTISEGIILDINKISILLREAESNFPNENFSNYYCSYIRNGKEIVVVYLSFAFR